MVDEERVDGVFILLLMYGVSEQTSYTFSEEIFPLYRTFFVTFRVLANSRPHCENSTFGSNLGYNECGNGLQRQRQRWQRQNGILRVFYCSALGASEVRGGESQFCY